VLLFMDAKRKTVGSIGKYNRWEEEYY